MSTTRHDIARLLDRRDTKQVGVILLDSAKVFDKVPYRRLTLYRITAPSLHWTYRTQRVLLMHLTVPVSSGVPQGTVLGHLPLSTLNSSTRLFADDILLFRPIKLKTTAERLGKVMANVLQTRQMQGTPVSPDHTNQCNTPLSLHTQQLTSYKYLGIHLTSNLTFNTHIGFVTNKANRKLEFLRRKVNNCTPDIKHIA